ncbi:unnamed protein product [Notodromas monacha]|uniref:Glycosyltransferase 2-like domain-containing protein n=1 Tax=Notodromas monacha TaxID=399045 RepID=A0A7R9BXK7_9CRUS|nr:unnamed protein product [Notodromas monacha]CAG0921982.1 unnamed protein product [Notodromas monacha]
MITNSEEFSYDYLLKVVKIQFNLVRRRLLAHFRQEWAKKNVICWLVFLVCYSLFPVWSPSGLFFYFGLVAGIPALIFGPVFSGLLFMRIAIYGFPGDTSVALCADVGKLPKLRVRVFTRGLEEGLVSRMMMHNIGVFKDIGFNNYDYIVVSNVAPVNLPMVPDVSTGNLFVSQSYQTKTNAMYKARSMQFCLDEERDTCPDSDYMLVLDEDVQLTPSSVRGVLNFMHHGFEIGDGIYSSLGAQQWALQDDQRLPAIIFETQRCATLLIAELFKKLGIRQSFAAFGGFLILKIKTARELGFDCGETLGIAEDLHLMLRALSAGYTIRHVDGFVKIKSTTNIQGVVDQRRRFAMGYFLHCFSGNKVSMEFKRFTAIYFWSTWLYPVLFMMNVCAFHDKIWPFVVTCLISEALATFCTLKIASNAEGLMGKEFLPQLLLSMYATPMRYWYGMALPGLSATKGFLFNNNLAEWKARPKG